MKDLINLKEKHYVVQYLEKTYAVNGIKYPVESLETEKIMELHPISNVGIINYNEIVKVKGSTLKLVAQPVNAPL